MKTITTIIPRYQETDKMGIIHHSVYPIWYEAGRVDFCRELGFPYYEIEKRNITQALIDLRVIYKSPAYFGDQLTLVTEVKLCTKVKMEFYYQIYNQEGKLINIGSTLLVWLNQNLQPINITKEHADIYQAILESMEENE